MSKRYGSIVAGESRRISGTKKENAAKGNIIDTSFDEISVEDGSGKTVTKWVFNVEDISLIPIEYLNVNEKAVKKAINNGIRDIPGVKY